MKAATDGINLADTDDNKLKSDFAVIMDIGAENLGYYDEAIQLDPNNKYAKSSLNELMQ